MDVTGNLQPATGNPQLTTTANRQLPTNVERIQKLYTLKQVILKEHHHMSEKIEKFQKHTDH
jgi:hypothetical protein